MSRSPLLYPFSLALATTLVLAACKKPEPVPAPTPPVSTSPEPVAPAAPAVAASVTAVDLGNAVDADNRVSAPGASFAPGDTIYAAVTTATNDPVATVPATLAAHWTYQDGQTVSQDSRQLNLTGPGTTTFHISKPDGFPTGRYRVDISLDGNLVQSREFEVK